MPINVRTIDGIDIDSLTLKYYDGAKEDPQYEV
jgi:phage tail protein X